MFIKSLADILMRGYADNYGCGSSEADHTCHDCPGDRIIEFGRARSAGYIKKAYLPTLLSNPIDPVLWTDGIAAKNVIMIPETSGSYDPGTPKELPGFGDRKVSYGARTMTLNFKDPDYYENYAFWNEISRRIDLVPFFRTSNLVHIFDSVATIVASDPVTEDIEDQVLWNVVNTVVSGNLPTLHKTDAIVSIFTCPNF